MNTRRRHVTILLGILLTLAIILGGGAFVFWAWWIPKITVVNESGVLVHGVTVTTTGGQTHYIGRLAPSESKSVRVMIQGDTSVRVRGILADNMPFDGAGLRGTGFDDADGYMSHWMLSYQRHTVVIGPGGTVKRLPRLQNEQAP